MEIRKSTAFLAGAALSSSLLWGILHFSREADQQEIARNRDRLEDYLGMKDQELLSRRSEIEKIQGLEGRMMLALLACIGIKARSGPEAGVSAPSPSSPPAPSSGTAPGTAPPAGSRPTSALPPVSPPLPDFAPQAAESPTHSAAPASPAVISGLGVDLGSELFCHEVKGTPARVSPENWNLSFPFDPGSQEREQDFGMIDSSEYEADSALDSRICRSPRFLELTAQRRRANRFFQRIHGRVFTGPLKITTRPRATYQVHFHSNGAVPEPVPAGSNEGRAGSTPIATPDREYWQISRGEGHSPEDLPENRIVAYAETHPVWRYNPCFRSVTIVNDFCPWGSIYDRESKDLFFFGNTGRILGNVYCRKRSDHSWERVGTLNLRSGGN